MIISHEHKFIFIKTNKTAGTSIEIALSSICGPRDIITPISPEDERLRLSLGYRGPQNCRGMNGVKFVNHLSAEKVRLGIDKKTWDQYYKFCFERNPWDRLISMYYWRNKSEPRISISEFLASETPLLLIKKGRDLYTIKGEVVVDKICLFENIAEELEQVFSCLGITRRIELPRTKSKFRKDKRHYRDILSTEEQKKIADIFHVEIERFGYVF
jgi:hypothetical protein